MQMMIKFTLVLLASAAVADATQLRSALRTAPDMATEVLKDAQQNVQIHDSFASEAAADVEVEKRIESNPELHALLQIDASRLRSSTGTAPDMAAEVAREAQENIQIHDGFASMAAADVDAEKHVKANRELQALLQIDATQLRSTGRTAPDMAAEVAREGKDNIQIHDGFASMAASDVEVEKHIEANHELQALVQVGKTAVGLQLPALLQVGKRQLRSTARTAPDMVAEVAREAQDTIASAQLRIQQLLPIYRPWHSVARDAQEASMMALLR